MLRRRMHEWSSLRKQTLWILCLPRNITQRLADQHYTFGESDAWLDLWCHTVWAGDRQCVFLSGACRSIRETWRRFDIGSLGTALGLEKTKVWEIFSEEWGCLRSAPSGRAPTAASFSTGLYPLDTEASLPTGAEIERIIEKMRILRPGNAHIGGVRTMHRPEQDDPLV